MKVDPLGIEPRASRMLSGCDATAPQAPRELGLDPNSARVP